VTCLKSKPELLPMSSDIWCWWVESRAAARNCDINQYYGRAFLLPLLLVLLVADKAANANDASHISVKGLRGFLELFLVLPTFNNPTRLTIALLT
jgi:hypothetical protein